MLLSKSTLCSIQGFFWSLLSLSLLLQVAQAEGNIVKHAFGDVNFENSCSPSLNQTFQFGVAAMYSFWFDPAEKAFQEVIQKEPTCCIAYWGLSNCLLHPIWDYPTHRMELGWSIMQRALACIGEPVAEDSSQDSAPTVSTSANVTEREKKYVRALAGFFRPQNISNPQRLEKFSRAMETVYFTYGRWDENAGVTYGLSLLAYGYYIDDSTQGYPRERKAAAIEQLVQLMNSNNPGALHFIIHSYDQPKMAQYALPAAQKYAKVAPGVPHALHMPSHIFVDVGRWQDAIDSNKASMNSAYDLANATIDHDWLHASSFIVYSYLQMGLDKAAAALVDSFSSSLNFSSSDDDAVTLCVTHFLIETRDWTTASNFELHQWLGPPIYHWKDKSYSLIYSYFTQMLGRIHSADPKGARQSFESMLKANASLLEPDWGLTQLPYWRDSFTALLRSADAWIHWLDDPEKGRQMMQAVVDYENSTFQPEIGYLLSAEEMLGEMFVIAGNDSAALQMFQLCLQFRPNRFWPIWGAGSCAERLHNIPLALQFYSQLVALAASDYVPPPIKGVIQPSPGPQPLRKTVVHAQQYIAKHMN